MLQKVTAKSIKDGFSKAQSDRAVVESTWGDVLYYTQPHKRDVVSTMTEGEKYPDDVYDDTAIQANLVLAAGLSGYMTNASQRWFEYAARDERLMDSQDARKYFADCTNIAYSVLGNSNFYQQVHEVYLDLGSIGPGFLYEEEDEAADVRFFARHPKEMYIIENDKGLVDIVYRAFKLTAWQAFNMFGKDKCGKSINKALENNDLTKDFDFVQYICPRHDRAAGKEDNLNLPFASYWLNLSDEKICKESGFMDFPFFVPRFYKNTAKTYGFGAGTAAYSNIKMLNKMMEYYIKGAETAIWPPFMLEHDSMIGSLDLRAGALNYQRGALSQGQQAQPIDIGMKAQIGFDFINRYEDKISRAFFADLFLMLANNKNMTATEVVERTQEKMLVLGPVLGRLQTELLTPMLTRTFNILQKRGKFPEPPQSLQGKDYDIIYISPLAKAQRASQAKDTITFLQVVGQMAQMAPGILDSIDGDTVIKKLSKMYSVDPDIIRDEDEVKAIRDAKDQAQREMQAMEMAQQMAGVMQTGAKANESSARAEASRASAA